MMAVYWSDAKLLLESYLSRPGTMIFAQPERLQQ